MILKLFMLLLLLVILAVAFVLLFLDPNVFKPRIQALAEQQGIHLDIAGDLEWQFWPSLGIAINDLSVASAVTPDDTLASLRSASLLVATKPLFNGELQVEHVLVDGAELTLEASEDGTKNWQQLKPDAQQREALANMTAAEQQQARQNQAADEADEADEPSSAPNDDPGRELSLAVERISVTDSQVVYANRAAGQTLGFTLEQLELTQFNLLEQPFGLDLKARLDIEAPEALPASPVPVQLELGAQMQLDGALSRFTLSDGQLSLALGKEQVPLTTQFSASGKDLQGALSYGASLAVEPFDLKAVFASLGLALPETANPQALTHLALNLEVTGGPNAISLSPLEATLDSTQFSGELTVSDFSTQALALTLVGDKINIDDYLPPPPPETDQASSASSAPVAGQPAPQKNPSAGSGSPKPQVDEIPLPLDAIRALNAQVQFDFGEAIVNKLTLEDLRLRIQAKDGVVQLTEASLNTYQGTAKVQGQLDARGSRATAEFTGDVTGVQLEPLLNDLQLEQNVQLTGGLNVKAKGATRGAFVSDLVKQLDAEAQLSGAEVTIAPLNVEKYFCQIVSLARDEVQSADGETSQTRNWPEFTEMSALDGTIKLKNQVITVENFEAGVEQLLLATQGQVNLAQQTYDFRLPLTLLEKYTSEEGCAVNSNYWLNRSLSLLRCKGSLESLSPLKDCRLDGKALESLTGDYAKYRLQKELTRQLGGDSEDGEKDDKTKAVEGILNRLLN
nr:AsmA family protein [Gilvimarinus xylanilyticus]